MLDVSSGGAKLQLQAPIEVPDDFILVLSKNGQVCRRCKIAWRSETEIGVQFVVAKSTDRN
jgi:PilZ domain